MTASMYTLGDYDVTTAKVVAKALDEGGLEMVIEPNFAGLRIVSEGGTSGDGVRVTISVLETDSEQAEEIAEAALSNLLRRWHLESGKAKPFQ